MYSIPVQDELRHVRLTTQLTRTISVDAPFISESDSRRICTAKKVLVAATLVSFKFF